MTHQGVREGCAPSACQRRITGALTLSVYADAAAGAMTLMPGHGPTVADAALQCAPGFGLYSHAAAQLFTLAGHLGDHHGELDEDELAAQLAADVWPGDDEDRISGTQQVLSKIAAGVPWWRVAPSSHAGQGSYGSDAAVRATAVGLLPQAGLAAVAQLARRSAMVTHAHAEARDGAAVQATAVTLAAQEQSFDGIDTEKFLALIVAQCRTRRMRSQLAIVRQLAIDRAAPAQAATLLGCPKTAAGAAGAALTAFLLYPSRPLEAIRYVLLIGRGSHAAAVMTAAICGVGNPQVRPPLIWAQAAGVKQQIDGMAKCLAASPAPMLRRHRQLASAR